MNIDLRGQNILVTGASGGIGAAITRDLAYYGATVGVHCHRNVLRARKFARGLGPGAVVFPADLSRPEDCAALFRAVMKKFKRIHTLVNNAGIYESSPLTCDRRRWIRDWQRTIDTNLTSTGTLCREAVRHFRKNGGGRIVNVASRAAFRGDDQDHWAYAAAKAGMVALSRTIARTCGKDNIMSFVIAPGYVRTRMTRSYLRKHETAMIADELALNRVTEPEDIAPLISFLASGLMDHATGCTIDINAGSYVR